MEAATGDVEVAVPVLVGLTQGPPATLGGVQRRGRPRGGEDGGVSGLPAAGNLYRGSARVWRWGNSSGSEPHPLSL